MERNALRALAACCAAVAGLALTLGPAHATDRSARKARAVPLAYDETAAKAIDATGLQFEYRAGDLPACDASGVVYFGLNSAELDAAAKEALKASLEKVDRACRGLSVTIEAATDTAGPAALNEALSARRAAAVRSELVALGFAEDAIFIVALGESRPARATADGVREAANRRAEVMVSAPRPAGLANAVGVAALEKLPTVDLDPGNMPGFGTGDLAATYDVILEPGHYQRFRGATGATGEIAPGVKVSERALASQIVALMAKRLKDQGYKVLVIPADGYARGLSARVFLSVHLDGAKPVCTTKSSLGYNNPAYSFAAHAFGHALAVSLGIGPAEFMADNFTANLQNYNVFRKLNGTELEAIIEVAEVTCPEETRKVIDRGRLIADNLATGVEMMLKLRRETAAAARTN